MKKRLLLAASLFSIISVGCNSISDTSSGESKPVTAKESAIADTSVTEISETTVASSDKIESENVNIDETDNISETSIENNEENSEENYDSEDNPEVYSGPSIQTLDELIEKNFDCMTKIFILGSLPAEGSGTDDPPEEINWDDENSYIRKVTDSRFPDYAAFSEYIHSVYADDEANRLLNNYPFEGDPKYLNKDGELYLDKSKDGGKGYYVNWQDRTISITEQNENTCSFIVETTITEPGENPVEEPYIINCTAVCENGNWVLEEMYS